MASYKKKDQYYKSYKHESELRTLKELFGKILHTDIIESVAKSQQWNIEKACCILTEMTKNVAPTKKGLPKKKQTLPGINSILFYNTENDDADVIIESETRGVTASSNYQLLSNIVSKKQNNSSKTANLTSKGGAPKKALIKSNRELHQERICLKILSGNRVMVIMRGLPGSGKSYLARHLVAKTVAEDHRIFVFSTDDFFVNQGMYTFNPMQLQAAHIWNQKRTREAAQMGISPLIIDNTNTETWEMQIYAMIAVEFGYELEILEPDTAWQFNVPELTRRNIHQVPKHKIAEMAKRYEKNINVNKIFSIFKLKYPANKQPPQSRLFPSMRNTKIQFEDSLPNTGHTGIPFVKKKRLPKKQRHIEVEGNINCSGEVNYIEQLSDTWESDSEGTWEKVMPDDCSSLRDLLSTDVPYNMEYVLVNPNNTFVYQKDHKILSPIQIEKKYDLIKFTDNEVQCSSDLINFTNNDEIQNNTASGAYQPDIESEFSSLSVQSGEQTVNNNISTNNIKHSIFAELDFGLFGSNQPWKEIFKSNINSSSDVLNNEDTSEMLSQMISKENSTNTSSLDFLNLLKAENNENEKILFGSDRNISDKNFPKEPKPPPKVLLLDKGTMTGIENILETATLQSNCNEKMRHLSTLLNLFPQVQRDLLQDIFEKCQGDINWTVDLLLECNSEMPTQDKKKTLDIEANCKEQLLNEEQPIVCKEWHSSYSEDCNCTYKYEVAPCVTSADTNSTCSTSLLQPTHSETCVQYIPKLLTKQSKTKNKSPEDTLKKHIEERFIIGDEHYSEHLLNLRRKRHGEVTPNTCTNMEQEEEQSVVESDPETESEEESVQLNFGVALIEQLEQQVGNSEVEYPRGFQPVLQLPTSLARQLYALWLESVSTQMHAQNSVLEEVERQDQELARQLQQREAQICSKEMEQSPEVPDLQEIMDMEIALAIYRADQQQWRCETPDDLASRMTHQKLYEAFPDLDRDVLIEILQAHGNSFEKTVEVLFCSTGKQHTNKLISVEGRIKSKTGVEELAKQKYLLKQERERENDHNQKGNVEHNASYYREQAAHHLEMRQQLFRKAQESIQKGMPQVASYYSEVARLHMQKYEMANNCAACAFLSEHSKNHGSSCTLDLHYLYVREAEQALAVFLDGQISQLQLTGRRQEILFIITGRGKHSAGSRSQIKPVIKRRLKERNLKYSEVNPGLVKVIITKHSVLTNDMKNT